MHALNDLELDSLEVLCTMCLAVCQQQAVATLPTAGGGATTRGGPQVSKKLSRTQFVCRSSIFRLQSCATSCACLFCRLVFRFQGLHESLVQVAKA